MDGSTTHRTIDPRDPDLGSSRNMCGGRRADRRGRTARWRIVCRARIGIVGTNLVG
jgi:hypothetical protein